MELREREAARAGKPVKRVQRWVPYSRISTNLRRAVLAAEDSAFFEHEGIDIERDQEVDPDQHRARAIAARRQHHHAAARQESVSVAVARSAAQGSRADDHVAPRGGALEGAHLRDLSERDRVGRSACGAPRRRRAPTSACRPRRCRANRRRCSPARSSIRASTVPAHPRGRLLRRQQIILARMPGYEPPAVCRPRRPSSSRSHQPTRCRRQRMSRPARPSSTGTEGDPPCRARTAAARTASVSNVRASVLKFRAGRAEILSDTG